MNEDRRDSAGAVTGASGAGGEPVAAMRDDDATRADDAGTSKKVLPEQLREHGAELLPEVLRSEAATTASDDEEDPDAGEGPLWHRLAARRFGPGRMRSVFGLVSLALALVLGVFQLYIMISFAMDARQQRLVHLVLVLAIVFLVVPASKKPWGRSKPMLAVDIIAVGGAVVACVYPVLYAAELARRAGAYTTMDWALGLLLVALLLEATRRTV